MINQLKLPSVTTGLIATVLIAIFCWLCLDLAHRSSCTVDEDGHLGAGVSYWVNGDYRVFTSNLFFAQKFEGIGPYLGGFTFPSKQRQAALNNYYPNQIGDEYLFKSGNNASHILIAGRAMTTLLGAGLGFMVFLWARRIFGDVGGLGALTFFVFCPLVISNASLVTTDLATALWYTAAVGTYWRFICEPNSRRSLLAGVALGLLLLTKYSGLGFVAIAAALLGWRLWSIQRPRPWRQLAMGHVVLGLAAWITIWTFFGFHARPGGLVYPWAEVGPGTILYRVTSILRTLHLFPDPYLYDLTGMRLLSMKHYSFLAGHIYSGGTWLFFPAILLLKTPPAMLVAVAIAGLVSLRAGLQHKTKKPNPANDTPLVNSVSPWWIFIAVYLAMTMMSNRNAGARHLLPIYPALCIVGGGGLSWLAQRRWTVAALLLVFANVGEAAWFHGREHAYLSPIAGGPTQGYRWFVDSTIDWGADLPRLSTWQAQIIAHEPNAQFFIGQLAVPDLEANGVQGTLLSMPGSLAKLHAGYYIFSATVLQAPYTSDNEIAYQEILRAPNQQPVAPAQRDGLAAGRLGAYCRQRVPDGRIGDIYFFFRLTDEDVRRVLYGPPPTLEAIPRTPL
ncbi:MAG TPA: phospholipid carrier-dependent glycosyltransferase [Opitutaceae bacterium]|nr:phospholipid carrier-dependent glycosyltransferase [Opitutaceae bacterium]